VRAAAPPNAGADPYLDTLYACAKQVASGITTTVHSHQYMDGPVDAFEAEVRPVLDAYRDSGLRCAFTLGIRDSTGFSFVDDPEFRATLPPDLVSMPPGRCDMTFDQYTALLRTLAADYPTIGFQLGPWNPVFCSDALLAALADASRRDGWRIQTHLNETMHQAAYGRRQHGKSWVRRLDELGLLSERFSGAHGVWLDDGDIEILARAGAQIVYNPSSNLRLRSGLAPVRALLRGGVKVAFGLDSLSLNDDDDMLQDLRLGQLIQSGWGIDGDAIPAASMLEMATATAATVAGIAGVGALTEGGCADAVLLSLADIEGVPGDHAVSEALLKRGRAAHVRTVVIGGKVMVEEGRWAGRGPAELLAALAGAGVAGPREPEAQLLALKEAVRGYLRRQDA
jgi:cytosine/adenosine deaminase-related metal-dependent hydrolase